MIRRTIEALITGVANSFCPKPNVYMRTIVTYPETFPALFDIRKRRENAKIMPQLHNDIDEPERVEKPLPNMAVLIADQPSPQRL